MSHGRHGRGSVRVFEDNTEKSSSSSESRSESED